MLFEIVWIEQNKIFFAVFGVLLKSGVVDEWRFGYYCDRDVECLLEIEAVNLLAGMVCGDGGGDETRLFDELILNLFVERFFDESIDEGGKERYENSRSYYQAPKKLYS